MISIFSDANFFAVNILETLLSRNCFINILTDDVKGWNKITEHLTNRSHFAVLSERKNFPDNFNYCIIISGFRKGDPYEKINEVYKKHPLGNSKNLILMPFEKFSFSQNSRFNPSDNTGVIYVGDMFGPRMDLDSDLMAAYMVSNIISNRRMKLGVGELIYPLFAPDVAKTIAKWLFSFGPYGKETLLLGPQTSGSVFWQENERIVGKVKLTYDNQLAVRVVPKGIDIKDIPCNLKFVMTETYKWFSQKPRQGGKSALPFLFISKKVRRYSLPEPIRPLVLITLVVLFLPVFLLLINGGLFFLSYREFIKGNDNFSENSLLVAKTLSVISREESKAFSLVPLLGKVYGELLFASEVSERVSNMGVSAIPVMRETAGLTDKILGNQIYNPQDYSDVLKEGLDSLFRETSLLEADTTEASSRGIALAGILGSRVDLDKIKNLTLQGKTIADNLPALTGKIKSQTYLLLFENNMELRPTGGFIGSFGILTFDGGRISDLTVNDVYSADGQLNGHVEPPAPIKNYLGEANWWLRDSNWDPDFPTSAKRAEWFLDKEMGRQVDGVISVDLRPIQDILRFTGPIFLPDYNMSVSADNIYQKTQEEVEQDFFPGTHKKASFLSALSRSLLSEVSKLSTDQKVNILKAFYGDLEGRHIQTFLHDDLSQSAISNLGWDGAVNPPSCGETCYPDMVGIVEANVGVNKANYFIKRTEALNITVTSSKVSRNLTLTLQDQANPALGPSGRYKVYTRLLSPEDSQVVSVKSITGDVAENLTPEISVLKGRKETGVLVEILGGQTKKVEFNWESPLIPNLDKYGVYVRKQAGVSDDQLTLTINGRSVYNSPLVNDYFNRFSF